MKFLRCSIIAARRENLFFFLFFLVRLNLQYSTKFFFSSTLDRNENEYVTRVKADEVDGIDGQFFALHTNTFVPDEFSLKAMDRRNKSSGNVIFEWRSVTQGHCYAGWFMET